jgi:retinol dehydrogenase-12
MSPTTIITGANAGIGFETARKLAAKGHQLVLICRNPEKGNEAVQKLRAEFPSVTVENIVADLGDLPSVKKAAEYIVAHYTTIDVLINNAGYLASKYETVNGIEKTFYASHLGHFLLTQILMPVLLKSGQPRIINVASEAHRGGKASRFYAPDATHSLWNLYMDAKLANILHAKSLANRYGSRGLLAFSLHPGVVQTQFFDSLPTWLKVPVQWIAPLFFINAEEGARTSAYLATTSLDDVEMHNGRYFIKNRPAKTRSRDANDKEAEKLWSWSERFLEKAR